MFITARKRSCGKVMFLHLSVSHSVHRGGISLTETPSPDIDPPRDTPPLYGKERVVRILLECILVEEE